MINDVTDTNVWKMTEEEAIAWFEDEVEGLRGDSKYKALLIVAIEALQFIESLKKELELMQEEHPYKFFGNPESYSPYNEGWCDATDRIESMANGWMKNDSVSLW